MRDFSSLLDKLSKKTGEKSQQKAETKVSSPFRKLTVKEVEKIEALLLKKAKAGESHALIRIDPELGPAFQDWCDERGFFVIDNTRLAHWASSIKGERLVSRFYGYGGHYEFLNTQENYTETRESIERKIEHCDLLEIRAAKISSLEKAYKYIKDGSEFFDDYISEFQECIDNIKKTSDPYHLYYDGATNMSAKQVEKFCFFSESICYIRNNFDFELVFEDIDGGSGLSISTLECDDETYKSIFVVRWDDYWFLKNNFEPLHCNNDIWLHPPKLLLDYKLLAWIYDINADIIFDRISQWMIKECENGNDYLVFFIQVNPENYSADIYYKGELEWSIPVCPLRFSLAAKLRNLPVEISLVTKFGNEDLYFEEVQDYKAVVKLYRYRNRK